MCTEINNGGVALLDALGTKNHNYKNILQQLKKIEDNLGKFKNIASENLGFNKKNLNLYSFGDTIIIWYNNNSVNNKLEVLEIIGISVKMLIKYGMENGLFFRGAISYGDFYIHSTDFGVKLIGPAITDVASWYEESEWIGAFTTPLCSQHVKEINMKLKNTYKEGYLDIIYQKYDVPMKNCDILQSFAVKWYDTNDKESKSAILENLYSSFQKGGIPKGTEQKYINTEKFIKDIINSGEK